jgi:hypothetical protein
MATDRNAVADYLDRLTTISGAPTPPMANSSASSKLMRRPASQAVRATV